MSGWLPGAIRHDLSGHRGNGPFNGKPHGVVLHVNASGKGSQGTSAAWYIAGGGPDEVCPTWQVMTDGTIYQFLPADWEPWTQRDGNSWGPSIETGGDPSEPLSAAQVASCGRIMAFCHTELGVPLAVTDSLSGHGLGTHAMGGQAWGGHPCPGSKRAAQRSQILDAARGHRPAPTPQEDTLSAAEVAQINAHTDAAVKAIVNAVGVQHAHLATMLGAVGSRDLNELKALGQIETQVAEILAAGKVTK